MSTVRITRTALGQYVATNEAGTELGFGEGEDQFSLRRAAAGSARRVHRH